MTPEHRPRAPRHGDIEDVTIDDLTHKGLGRATLSLLIGPQREAREYTVNVPRALPSERVRVRLTKRRRAIFEAALVEIIESSPERVEAPCPHYGVFDGDLRGCGGCALQSLPYAAQLRFKHAQIQRAFRDHGLDPDLVSTPIGLSDPWYYRNKMEFSFGLDPRGRFALGLHPAGRRYDVLRLGSCALLSPLTSALLPRLRDAFEALDIEPYVHRRDAGWLRTLTVREGKRTGERMIELTTSAHPEARLRGEMLAAADVADVACAEITRLCAELGEPVDSLYWTQQRIEKGTPTRLIEHLISGRPTLKERLHLPGEQQLEFEIHPRAFFQPNTLQAERLYAEVLTRTGLLDADTPPLRVLDLYCGTGTIALCLAPYAAHVYGVDLQKDAIENARSNAAHNNLENTTFFAGDVADVLKAPPFIDQPADLVVVDPPRSGLFPAAVEQLKKIAPQRIVYVSCNPLTLAKNLNELTAAGYRMDPVQPVDMFPHTWHVENVTVLHKIDGPSDDSGV